VIFPSPNVLFAEYGRGGSFYRLALPVFFIDWMQIILIGLPKALTAKLDHVDGSAFKVPEANACRGA